MIYFIRAETTFRGGNTNPAGTMGSLGGGPIGREKVLQSTFVLVLAGTCNDEASIWLHVLDTCETRDFFWAAPCGRWLSSSSSETTRCARSWTCWLKDSLGSSQTCNRDFISLLSFESSEDCFVANDSSRAATSSSSMLWQEDEEHSLFVRLRFGNEDKPLRSCSGAWSIVKGEIDRFILKCYKMLFNAVIWELWAIFETRFRFLSSFWLLKNGFVVCSDTSELITDMQIQKKQSCVSDGIIDGL